MGKCRTGRTREVEDERERSRLRTPDELLRSHAGGPCLIPRTMLGYVHRIGAQRTTAPVERSQKHTMARPIVEASWSDRSARPLAQGSREWRSSP